MKRPVTLGDRYTDPITGFTGTAICRTVYLHGCARVGLQPTVDKDGKVPDPVYFDELQLTGVKPTKADKAKGGPRPDPPARA